MGPTDNDWDPQLDQPDEELLPEREDEDVTEQIPGAAGEIPAAADVHPRRIPKKRTKTGCLTCRKRRIKCGEEKPICNNCIKSKRECEGYAQRLIFKRPEGILGAFGPSQPSSASMQSMRMGVSHYGPYGTNMGPHQRLSMGSHLPMLAPRLTSTPSMEQDQYPTPSAPPSNGPSSGQFYYPPVGMRTTPQSTSSTSESAAAEAEGSLFQSGFHEQPAELPPTRPGDVDRSPVAGVDTFQHRNQSGHQDVPRQPPYAYLPALQQPAYSTPQIAASRAQDASPTTQTPTSYEGSGTLQFTHEPSQQPHPSYHPESYTSPESFYQDAYEDDEDDYSDDEWNEEMPDQSQAEDFNQLSVIMSSVNRNEHQLRSFTTHLNEPNILAFYRPSFGSSPLNNPKTARIFIHFLHSTAPSLSIFERHPTDSSINLGARVPTAQQGLWTHTLPLVALENQPLLQAILAVSSLHIAFLQQAPATASLKHYHYALKRIGTAVSLPARRKQIGTLAAILLLGYYEVIAAEYAKWSSHIGGSTQLVREIDFARTTRDLRAHRRRVNAHRERIAQSRLPSLAGNYFFHHDVSEDDPFAEKESSIDQNFISSIVGRAIDYDQFGQVEDGQGQPPRKHFTRKDIENYRIQCDLFWWYSKQDVFQTLISGNKLFTPYDKWGQCPPRAGIGRLDAVYGSADHLWLLLARLADFGYRDRKRKLKAVKNSGSEWKPNQEFFKFMGRFAGGPRPGQGGPSESGGSDRSQDHTSGRSAGSPGGIPSPQVGGRPMYGMIPPLGPIRLNSAFANSADKSSDEEGREDESDRTYHEAEAEWENILAAFDNFAHALGRDYLPLPPDSTPPISTPFGLALQYRTNTIAVVWGFYYTGRIILHRIHPSMPPAMMVASGLAAPTTAEYGQIIGRIAGGIYCPQRYNFQAGRLNPNMGSSLVEITVPIYFAAVQYTDPAQRSWIVTNTREVSRLTGWTTASVMVRGCESAWIVAAKQGRGPPYQRTDDSGEQTTPFNESHQSGESNDSPDQGSSERRFVALSKSSRSHWAMGILSLEDDILNLEIDERR